MAANCAAVWVCLPWCDCYEAIWVRLGDGGERLRRDGRWGVFLARYGFVFLPLTCACVATTLFMVMVRLYIETDVNAFGVIGLGFVLVSGACVIWAIKEYWRPSRWRRRPAWLDDFERDMGMRR